MLSQLKVQLQKTSDTMKVMLFALALALSIAIAIYGAEVRTTANYQTGVQVAVDWNSSPIEAPSEPK